MGHYRKHLKRVKLTLLLLLALSVIFVSVPATAASLCRDLFSGKQFATLTATMKYAEDTDVRPNSVSAAFYKLASVEYLTPQKHRSLVKRNLVLEDKRAGLCGPVCATNIVQTFYSFRSIPAPLSRADMVKWLVDTYPHFANGNNALMGTSQGPLFALINQASPKIGLKARNMNRDGGWSPAELAAVFEKNPNGIIMATIQMEQGDHYIAILNILPEEGMVVYSDPNRPNTVIKAPYRTAKKDGVHRTIALEVLPGYGEKYGFVTDWRFLTTDLPKQN